MSRLFVIGAGSAQVDAIVRAKELGISVIAVDGDPHAPGLKIADYQYVADITNPPEIMKIADEIGIDGVISFSVEAAVRTVAIIADKLNLPGLSIEAARNATSKKRMRKIWTEKGIPSCKSICCNSIAETIEATQTTGFPIVIKPPNSAGSRGVKLVSSLHELDDAFMYAKAFSKYGEVLVEEFMPGFEMSIEGFIYNGTFQLIGLSDKIRSRPPYLLDIAVIFPSERSKDLQDEVVDIVTGASSALGLDMTPVHAEVMVTPEGPKMVEIAARGPGFKVFSMMLPWVSGIDVITISIQMALGIEPQLSTPIMQKGAALIFPQSKPGRVLSVKGINKALNIPQVYDVSIYVEPGDMIRPLQTGNDRIGHIIALDDSRKGAKTAAQQAEDLIDIRVD